MKVFFKKVDDECSVSGEGCIDSNCMLYLGREANVVFCVVDDNVRKLIGVSSNRIVLLHETSAASEEDNAYLAKEAVQSFEFALRRGSVAFRFQTYFDAYGQQFGSNDSDDLLPF